MTILMTNPIGVMNAVKNIAETLLEAEKRKMWNAKDSMKKELEKLYLSIEGTLEEDDDDDDED